MLDQLPPELIVNIVSFLPASSFQSFLLSSHCMRYICFQAWAQVLSSSQTLLELGDDIIKIDPVLSHKQQHRFALFHLLCRNCDAIHLSDLLLKQIHPSIIHKLTECPLPLPLLLPSSDTLNDSSRKRKRTSSKHSLNIEIRDGQSPLFTALDALKHEMIHCLLETGKASPNCTLPAPALPIPSTPIRNALPMLRIVVELLWQMANDSFKLQFTPDEEIESIPREEHFNNLMHILESLIQAGVEPCPFQHNPILSALEEWRACPPHPFCSQLVSLLLQHPYLWQQQPPSSAPSKQQQPILFKAIRYHSKWLVDLILSLSTESIKQTWRGDSALHVAIRSGDSDIVRSLLSHGIDPNLSPSSFSSMVIDDDDELTPPLILAVKQSKNDSTSCVEALLQAGAIVDAVDANERTAFWHACQCGNIAIARLLLSYKANLLIRDLYGENVVHVACKWNQRQILLFLIENAIQLFVETDKKGRTPFDLLKLNGFSELQEHLRTYLTLVKRERSSIISVKQ